MSAPSEPEPPRPFTQDREFWVLVGFAVALGVFGALAGLVFMGVIGFGGGWYVDSRPGWLGGSGGGLRLRRGLVSSWASCGAWRVFPRRSPV
jgi:hypothetical protein